LASLGSEIIAEGLLTLRLESVVAPPVPIK
jgi:hypothetical protein